MKRIPAALAMVALVELLVSLYGTLWHVFSFDLIPYIEIVPTGLATFIFFCAAVGTMLLVNKIGD